jgi:hypothetical protein
MTINTAKVGVDTEFHYKRNLEPQTFHKIHCLAICGSTGRVPTQIVRRYLRDGSVWRENSAGKLGL